jgi:hypothetical protein
VAHVQAEVKVSFIERARLALPAPLLSSNCGDFPVSIKSFGYSRASPPQTRRIRQLPVSTASAGGLAGVLDPGYVFASLGLIWAVFCTAQLFKPYLLRVDDKA